MCQAARPMLRRSKLPMLVSGRSSCVLTSATRAPASSSAERSITVQTAGPIHGGGSGPTTSTAPESGRLSWGTRRHPRSAMAVVHVINRLAAGGAERQLLELAQRSALEHRIVELQPGEAGWSRRQVL